MSKYLQVFLHPDKAPLLLRGAREDEPDTLTVTVGRMKIQMKYIEPDELHIVDMSVRDGPPVIGKWRRVILNG